MSHEDAVISVTFLCALNIRSYAYLIKPNIDFSEIFTYNPYLSRRGTQVAEGAGLLNR